MASSITFWNRLEPGPLEDLTAGMAAEVRDPLWMLTRQWQMGEMQGEDAGSPAFVRLVTKTAFISDWAVAGGDGVVTFDGTSPFEAVALSEPHGTDVATQAELTQVFSDILSRALPADAPAIVQKFVEWKVIKRPDDDPFNPLDRASAEMLDVVADRVANGIAILQLAQVEPIVLPDVVKAGLNDTKIAAVIGALGDFRSWVSVTSGQVGTDDPAAWQPRQLAYRLSTGVTTAPGQRAALSITPSADGTLDWSSFDLTTEPKTLFDSIPASQPILIVPSRLRYPGMPWSRFWRFEDGDPSYPNVAVEPPQLLKMLVLDFVLKAGVDWFQVGIRQSVGTIARIESLIVQDVFGRKTVIDRADDTSAADPLERWTMFSLTDATGSLASFSILAPSAGRNTLAGSALEQVRFARDENANMSWGIEALTASPAGEPRPGNERDAAVAANFPDLSKATTFESPLRYLIENRVPIQWVPLVLVEEGANQFDLQRGVVALPTDTGVALASAIGKILNPKSLAPSAGYLIPDEEVPRAGLRVERFVTRARWINGSSHLWTSRRRRTGTGETQSGLAFDLAVPVPK